MYHLCSFSELLFFVALAVWIISLGFWLLSANRYPSPLQVTAYTVSPLLSHFIPFTYPVPITVTVSESSYGSVTGSRKELRQAGHTLLLQLPRHYRSYRNQIILEPQRCSVILINSTSLKCQDLFCFFFFKKESKLSSSNISILYIWITKTRRARKR